MCTCARGGDDGGDDGDDGVDDDYRQYDDVDGDNVDDDVCFPNTKRHMKKMMKIAIRC